MLKYHHLIHHQYSNDPWKESCENGHTMDPTSTYRFGKNGKQEAMISYCALSLFRDSTNFAISKSIKKGETMRLLMETLVMLGTISLWIWISWQWALFILLPLVY